MTVNTSEFFELLAGMITLINRILPFFCYIYSTNLQTGMNIYLFIATWVLTGAFCKNEHQIYCLPPTIARNNVGSYNMLSSRRTFQSSAVLRDYNVPEIHYYLFDKFVLKSLLMLLQQLLNYICRKHRPQHTTGTRHVMTWPPSFPSLALLLVLVVAVPLSLGCFAHYASCLSQMRTIPCPYQPR